MFAFATACDKEDNNVSTRNIEGHWVHLRTSADVAVTDLMIKKKIEDHIINHNGAYKISYEFKNDKTFYFYINFAEPVKGVYKMQDKNNFELEDVKGIKTGVYNDGVLYVATDIKKDIAKELEIEEAKIIKAIAINVYQRGLNNTDN